MEGRGRGRRGRGRALGTGRIFSPPATDTSTALNASPRSTSLVREAAASLPERHPASLPIMLDAADERWRHAEGWGQLKLEQQDVLRKHHLKHGCTVPWPVTGLEVPEMLRPPCISPLRVHPNQRFKVSIEDLPSFRMEMPGADIHGLAFPMGRCQAFLREIVEDDAVAYAVKVPMHYPEPTAIAVFGEVTFTPSCALSFKAFYDHGGSGGDGAYFAWPGGDASAVCPVTGAKIAPDGKTRHLLIAWEMSGTSAQDGNGAFATRIIPRLLTRAGYELMMSAGSDRCTHGVDASGMKQERPFFIPRRKTCDGAIGDLCKWGTSAPPANGAWGHIHSDGTYCAIERLLEDNRKKHMKQLNAGPDGVRMKSTGRSSGHSTYSESQPGEVGASSSGGRLSMAELKRAIITAGLTHDDCLEKADLLLRYKEAQEARTRESLDLSDGKVLPNKVDAPQPKPKPQACSHCGATGRTLLLCGRCVSWGRTPPAGYCDKECQKQAWTTHKKVCKRVTIGSDMFLGGGDRLCPVCKVTKVCTTDNKKSTATIFYCCGAEICFACSSRDTLSDAGNCPNCGEPLPTTNEQTLEWIHKAAKRGDPRAQLNLGRAYDEGRLNLPVDHTKAAHWIRKAAEQGHPKAEHDLGVCYRDGEGVLADAAEARKWFHRAALQGHALAQCNLGIMLVQACMQGENENLDDAEIWLRKAAAAGDELAESKVGQLGMIKKYLAEQTGQRWGHRIEEA